MDDSEPDTADSLGECAKYREARNVDKGRM